MSYAPGTGLDVTSPGQGATNERRQSFGMPEEITLDYTEINSVPPLPLWTLLAADTDDPRSTGGGVGGVKGGQVSKTYDDLFSSSPQVKIDMDVSWRRHHQFHSLHRSWTKT